MAPSQGRDMPSRAGTQQLVPLDQLASPALVPSLNPQVPRVKDRFVLHLIGLGHQQGATVNRAPPAWEQVKEG